MNYDDIIIKRGKNYRVFAGTELAFEHGNKQVCIKYFLSKINEIKELNNLLVHYCAFGLVNGMQLKYVTEILRNVQASEHYLQSGTREWWIYAYRSTILNHDIIAEGTGLKNTFVMSCLAALVLSKAVK